MTVKIIDLETPTVTVDFLEMELTHGLPHWLSPEAKLAHKRKEIFEKNHKKFIDKLKAERDAVREARQAAQDARFEARLAELRAKAKLAQDDGFDPNQLRDKDGKWAKTGAVAFVSPEVRTDTDFPGAVKGLESRRQELLREASQKIDSALGLAAHDTPAIGAWETGAEPTIVTTFAQGATVEQVKVAQAMKAYLADQLSTLVFADRKDGKHTIARFEAKGDVTTIHDNLLKDGVAFHTIVPHKGGAHVYVVSMDKDSARAAVKGAERYDTKPVFTRGDADFVGTSKEDGTDREKRDDARAIYRRVIEESRLPRVGAVWKDIRDSFGEKILAQDAGFKTDQRRDKDGKWTKTGESGAPRKSDAPDNVYERVEETYADLMASFEKQDQEILEEKWLVRERYYTSGAIEEEFPKLQDANYVVTRGSTIAYNCIALAFNYEDDWVWPGYEIDDFENIFRTYEATSVKPDDESATTVEKGIVKIALYANRDWGGSTKATHLARQLPSGMWLSKLGGSIGLRHEFDGLEGGSYGNIIKVYKIPIADFHRLSDDLANERNEGLFHQERRDSL
jgi:hypothetical protein